MIAKADLMAVNIKLEYRKKLKKLKEYVVLATVDAKRYQDANIALIREMTSQKIPGVYITLNKPYHTVKELFGKKGMFNRGNLLPVIRLSDDVLMASPICFESHTPGRMKDFVRQGANFIVNTSSNKWIKTLGGRGLDRYLGETLALRRIYAVWLGKPIIISGRGDYAGMLLPDGRYEVLDFKTIEGYTVYKGTIKI